MDFWDSLVTFKVNTLVAGSFAIGSALIGIGGTIASYHTRDAEISAEIAATRAEVRELKARFEDVQRSNMRVEEAQKLNTDMLRQLLIKKD